MNRDFTDIEQYSPSAHEWIFVSGNWGLINGANFRAPSDKVYYYSIQCIKCDTVVQHYFHDNTTPEQEIRTMLIDRSQLIHKSCLEICRLRICKEIHDS